MEYVCSTGFSQLKEISGNVSAGKHKERTDINQSVNIQREGGGTPARVVDRVSPVSFVTHQSGAHAEKHPPTKLFASQLSETVSAVRINRSCCASFHAFIRSHSLDLSFTFRLPASHKRTCAQRRAHTFLKPITEPEAIDY